MANATETDAMSTQTELRPQAATNVATLHRAFPSLPQEPPSRLPTENFLTYEPTLDACARKVVAVHASTTSTAMTASRPATSWDVGRHTDYSSLYDAVLECSIREVVAHNALPRGGTLALSVDASTHSLSDRSFPRRLMATLAEHGMDASQMTLCIAHDALPPDPRRAEAIAGAVRSTGCRLAVRAFAFQQGSLAQLVRVPADELRLDNSCVATIDSYPETLRAVRRLLRFAAAIGVPVVAEGVERLTQYEHLLALGCRYFQGPLILTPSPLLTATRAVVPGMPVLKAGSLGRTLA